MCGYPPRGNLPAGFQSWRYFQAFGVLEYRLGVDQSSGVPRLAAAELQTVRMMLAECLATEQAIWSARSNLDTDQAAVWTHNKSEVRDRWADFSLKRRHLCTLVGVPPGPDLSAGTGQPRLIV